MLSAIERVVFAWFRTVHRIDNLASRYIPNIQGSVVGRSFWRQKKQL